MNVTEGGGEGVGLVMSLASSSLWQAHGVYPTPSGAATEASLGNRTIPGAALPLALKWELMWT